VQLFVEEAKELKEADTFGSSDSYCKITGLYSSPSVVFLSLVSRLLVEGDIDLLNVSHSSRRCLCLGDRIGILWSRTLENENLDINIK